MYPGTYAASAPDRAAVRVEGLDEVLSYAELHERSTRLARLLGEHGLRRGDTVALLSDNSPRYFEVYWAALRSGLYITAINHHLAPDEVAYIVRDSEARALIVSANNAEQAEAVVADTPGVELRLAYGGEVAGHLDYAAALAATSGEALAGQPRGADMLYSSGTTGRPKGIKPELPENRIDEGDAIGYVFAGVYGFDENTTYLSPAPLYHAAPLRFCAAVQAHGGTVVMMRRFEPEAALRAIQQHRVTHSQWVPTMFVRMLKLPERVRDAYDVSSMRVAIHAAAPCPVDVKRAMIDWWGPVLHEYYAATEGHGITFIDSREWLRRPGSVGRAGLGVLHICDDSGAELASGEVGTVYFERDEPPFAYHNDPAKTRETQHPRNGLWTTVGDIGYTDEEGYLYLTDRKAFTIISGGVNIYPQEIENCLTMHPKVADVAVIGVSDPEMGESVQTVIVPADGSGPGEALEHELLEHVRARIAHYKVPRSIDFVGELPRTPTGKLRKRELQERYRASADAG